VTSRQGTSAERVVEPDEVGPPGRVHAVMIVEDHDVMREALVDAVGRMSGFEVCASAASGEDALRARDRRAADIVLVDMALPGMTGSQYVAEVKRRRSDVSCVILSGHRERAYVERAFAAGAVGYVVKGRPDEIERALRTVAAGCEYLSPSLR